MTNAINLSHAERNREQARVFAEYKTNSIGYEAAYAEGHLAGHEEGYSTGYTYGHLDGQRQAFPRGVRKALWLYCPIAFVTGAALASAVCWVIWRLA